MRKLGIIFAFSIYCKGTGWRLQTSRSGFNPSTAVQHLGTDQDYATKTHRGRRNLDSGFRSRPSVAILAEEDVAVYGEGVELRRERLESALAAFGLDGATLRLPFYAESEALRLYQSFIMPENNSALLKMDMPGREQNVAGDILYAVREADAAAASYLCNIDRSLEELARSEKPYHPIVLVLHDLHDGSDVGNIIRLAEIASLEQVVFCGSTPDTMNATVRRTTSWTEDQVPHRKEKDVLECVRQLRQKGYEVWAAGAAETPANSESFTAVSPLIHGEAGNADVPKKRLAIVLGNEQLGVCQSVLDACDHCIFVPTFGIENSLNAALRASIIVYDVLRQWGSLEPDKR